MNTIRLPLPVAQMRRRSYNAKSPKERHDAAYFAWEVSVRLCVALHPPRNLDPLARGSAGDWTRAVALDGGRFEEGPLLDFFALCSEVVRGTRSVRRSVSDRDLLEALPAYRNKVVAHGSQRPTSYYAKESQTLLAGLDAAWEAGLFLPSSGRLLFAESVSVDGGNNRLARLLDLGGDAPLVEDPAGTPVPGQVLPGRLYWRDRGQWSCLHPWFLFGEESERIFCFNKLARSGVEYLDYPTGLTLQGTELRGSFPGIEDELHALFATSVQDEPELEPKDEKRFGDFTVLGRLGGGGMGQVYLACQESLGRLVALKVLSTGASRDEVVPKRFQQEIEVISRCEHPNIVRIFSSGEREGDAYFAMEYVEGVDLSDLDPNQTRLEGLPAAVSAAFEKRRSENPQLSEKLPEPNGKQNGKQGPGSGADSYRELVRYFRDAARALQNLHEQGILHRDIKPANLMVTLEDQRAVLMDLGLAKIVDADLTLTREEDGILGTPRYMPPEQLRNRKDFPVDARSDVYSLGATLYEMITGHAFHDAETREDLGEKVLHEEPVPVRKHRPDAPERLCWIVQKATEKDPGDRYQSAADMARDLDSFLEDRLLIARKQSWPHVLKLWVRRHRELTRSLAASALVLIAITIWFVVRLGEAEARIAELRDDSRILIEVEPETPRDVVTAILKLGEEEPEFVVPLTQVEPDAAALGADKPRISFELPEGFDEKQLRTYAYRKVRTYCGDDPSKLEKMRAVSRELMQIFEEDYSLQGVPWNTFVSLVHRIGKDSRGAIARGPWFAAVTAEQYLGLEEFSLEGVEVLERDLELAPEEEASRKPAQGPEKLGQKTEAREQAAPAAGKAPDKLALVVAIQNYPDVIRKTFGALKGPLNDARLIRDTLAGHFGFREQDIKLLTDAEATHEAIVRAFYEWLILRAGKDTEAVFWYCGHGSRVRDESGIPGAEQDGMDTSFLTFDSRSEGRDGEYDLVDDELHSLLCALTKRTRHVTLVTDACYSGGGFRGASLSGVRGGPRGKHAFEPAGVESFWPAGVPLLEDGDPRREGLEGYVHISACSNKQRAWEIQDDVDVKGEGKVKAFGALTYYLTQAMRDVEVGTSYRRVADQVKLLVSRKIPGQTVWAEGELDRELFGSRFEARLPGFPAQIQRSFLSVHAGALHGLSKGSLLRVRGPGNEVLGTAIVTHLNSRFANADWKERNKPVDASTPLHVEEISRPAQLPPLTVYTESSRVAALFEGSPRVRVTNTKPKLRDYHLLAEDGAWALRTNEGIRIWAGKVFEKLDRRKLEDRFQKELQHRALWGLAQEPGSLRLAARFVPPEEEDFADLDDSKDAAVVPCQKQEGREYEVTLPPLNEDDLRLAVLEVTNKDRREVFITVLSINESREINVVWPRLGQRDRILPAGESCRVPIAVYSEPEWSLDRPMCDRYLVIATRRFVSFEPFVSDEALRAGREPLPGILQIAFDGNRTRSGRRIKVGLRNFGTTWVDLQIHKKQ